MYHCSSTLFVALLAPRLRDYYSRTVAFYMTVIASITARQQFLVRVTQHFAPLSLARKTAARSLNTLAPLIRVCAFKRPPFGP